MFFGTMVTTLCASDQEHIYYTVKMFRDMKVNRILLIIIAAVAIFAHQVFS